MGDAKLKVADALLAAGLEQAFRMGADKGAQEVVRLERVNAELLAALEALSQYTHEITDEGRNLEDPDDSEDYGKLRKQVAAALSKAKEGR